MLQYLSNKKVYISKLLQLKNTLTKLNCIYDNNNSNDDDDDDDDDNNNNNNNKVIKT